MAKRRGKTRHARYSRPVESKRVRFVESVRVYIRARLCTISISDADPKHDQHGRDEFGLSGALSAATDAEAIAFCRRIVDIDNAEDPELYCLSPVTDDEGEEF